MKLLQARSSNNSHKLFFSNRVVVVCNRLSVVVSTNAESTNQLQTSLEKCLKQKT